ncbi:hypothetical protein QDY71_01470 [Kingella negevensis]|uniref:hypothetical protein n=1 Tax=Kingella negevensis TaxID=1522312 RepID=UPI00255086B8|nr:hypothetical protein [Kingella negevensis]MDK4696462.1 hypothetical protein [Kingella negevensis]
MQSNAISLTFTRLRHTPPASNALPLALGKTQPETPINPTPQPEKPETKPIVATDFSIGVSQRSALAHCVQHRSQVTSLSLPYAANSVDVIDVSGCLKIRNQGLRSLKRHEPIRQTIAPFLSGYVKTAQVALNALSGCLNNPNTASEALHSCAETTQSAKQRLNRSANSDYSAQIGYQSDWEISYSRSASVHNCQHGDWQRTAAVPCEWYPVIELPAPVPKKRPCGAKPKSNAVPLHFTRRRGQVNPRELPLPFSCGGMKTVIPRLESYIMLNMISATSGSLKLNPLSASASCDTSGYYWTCETTLPPDDFAALNLAQYDQGKEPLITLQINEDTFTFIAESYRDNRQFGQNSYTVSGRSQTARLGADYAQIKQGIITQALYARQIADNVLADTSYRIGDWSIPDWLVPANVYSLADKTPIAVIADIAEAAGGFVESDTSERIIHVKPRYKTAAWLLQQAQFDVSVPTNVIVQISGKKQISTQCYGVFVVATHNQGVFRKVVRQESAGSPEASTLSHALYTENSVCQSAGIAALSDTGASKTEQIDLPIMPKYGLGRAKLGDIWQVAETNGSWVSVVKSVSISVEMENDAPKIMQSVGVFRYLGK